MMGIGRGGRMTVREVVEALRSGTIHDGMTLPVGQLPKPWVAEGRETMKGISSGIYVIRDGERVVILYHHDGGKLFAACTIERMPTWSETWHFCNSDMLRAHIDGTRESDLWPE